MALSAELNRLGVKALHVKPTEAKSSLVIGDAKESLVESLEHFSYLSPFEYSSQKLEFFAKYEVGSEEGVLAMILNFCATKRDERLDSFLENLDIGYISAECNIGEEEMEELALHVKSKYLYICEDLEYHERAENIAKLLSMCQYYCEFNIIYEKLQNDIDKSSLIIADEIEELQSFDGAIVHYIDGDMRLFGSNQFALSNRIKNRDMVLIKTKNNQFQREFVIKDDLKGTIALLESKKQDDTYAYEVSKITRIVNG